MITQNNTRVSEALQKLDIKRLNPMQEAALDEALTTQDLVLLSPTGSGKTLAFLLPLLLRLRSDDKSVQALILTPSRELALQIENVFKSMGTQWRCCCCYGGHPIAEERRSIEGNNPSIIIGTPGRVLDHIDKWNFNPTSIETLIIDEFDKSLEFGFHDQMADILSELPSLQKRILLSATDAEEIPEFTGLDNSVRINYLADSSENQMRLTMYRVVSPARDKAETLYRLLCTIGSSSSIVFCNHREAVDRVSGILEECGLYTERFHGGMEQPDRERALYKFRTGSCHVLVSTDLAARGLDIAQVEHIVHYHMPLQEDAFTHRNGRTARWESEGTAYLILCDDETLPNYIDDDFETLTLPENPPRVPKPLWTTLYIGKGKKDKISKADVAGFLYKKGGLSRDDVGQIDIRDHYGFVTISRDRVKSTLSLIRGEKIKGMRVLIEEARY